MNTFRLIACPTLSHEQRTDTYFDSGCTVGDYLRELGWKTDGLTARVFIDGQLVPDAEWLTAEPKPGQAVVVRRVYTGGQGGNQGKQILHIIGMLVVAVGAAYLAPLIAPAYLGKLAVPLTQAGLTIGGALALNGHVPRSRPRRALAQPRPLKEAA